jgi:hypothetical protein
MVFNATFNNISVIVAVSFIGGGNQRTRRKQRPVTINHLEGCAKVKYVNRQNKTIKKK